MFENVKLKTQLIHFGMGFQNPVDAQNIGRRDVETSNLHMGSTEGLFQM